MGNNIISWCRDDAIVIFEDLQHGLSSVFKWLKLNSLKANPESFQTVIIGAKLNNKMDLHVNDTETEQSNKVDLQGVTIEQQLKFKSQIRTYVELLDLSFIFNAKFAST